MKLSARAVEKQRKGFCRKKAMRLWAGHSGADSDIDRFFSAESQNDETVYRGRLAGNGRDREDGAKVETRKCGRDWIWNEERTTGLAMGIGDAVCGTISVVCGKRAGMVRQIVGLFHRNSNE
jgi:hypothetical protein